MSLINFLPKIRGTYRANADLSKTNWFRVGGPAEVLYKPADDSDLAFFLSNTPLDINITVLGVGSNIIIRDGGIAGVVIKLGKGFTDITLEEDYIIAGAGVLDYNLALFAKENSICGLEFFSGIPGTIGGALAMNAGAYGTETKDVLISAEAIDRNGKKHILQNKDFGFKYRKNSLPNDFIFTKAYFKAEKGDKNTIEAKIKEIREKRESTQPINLRTGGSTFANHEGYKAWELIDKAGCRGMRIGDAVISEKHCNFMVNEGSAKASDLETLGEEIKRKVKETSGIDLSWEIKRIGKFL